MRRAARGGRLLSAAPVVLIRHFTDPACPWAFSAEPHRLRLRWLYGDQIAWETRMVVLRERAVGSEEDHMASLKRLQHAHGMPIDLRPRRHVGATIHACRAVVAVRLRWPEREDAMLRRLRVLIMAGEPPDDSDTLELAASQAGLAVSELAAYAAEAEVEQALRADMAAARGFISPSYAIVRGGGSALARRPDPDAVADVLGWARMPLATVEIAAVCGRELADVRPELERVASFEPVGADGYWTFG